MDRLENLGLAQKFERLENLEGIREGGRGELEILPRG